MILQKVNKLIDSTLIDLGRQFRWSYLPPLMVYVTPAAAKTRIFDQIKNQKTYRLYVI